MLSVEEYEDAAFRYPRSASASRDFLSRYRVIGILKVEGRIPAESQQSWADGLVDRLVRLSEAELPDRPLDSQERSQLETWCREFSQHTSAREAAIAEAPEYPEFMRTAPHTPRLLALRKQIADAFSEYCRAEFTRQDTELLLLLGMQLGRLLTHRTIKYAASEKIIIGENEVGMLNVRWEDIRELSMLLHAADVAEAKIGEHLQQLKTVLDFDKRQAVHRTRISELLDPRGPIREIHTRRKTSPSLIQKLIRKQRDLDENTEVHEVHFVDLKAAFVGYGHLSSESFVGRGPTRVFLEKQDLGSARAVVQAELGMRGAPRLRFDDTAAAVVQRVRRDDETQAPLVRRILDRDFYDIDDLCGARVITDYDSDIDQLLDELRIRGSEWGFELRKVDDQREAGKEGYRAVHVTLTLDMEGHLPNEMVSRLRKTLYLVPLKVPVEIQLRTAYQDSWAKKTHAESYKRETHIPDELRDEWEILSNVLVQADWLSDIVKSGTEEALLPSDFGEGRLIRHLRRRLSRDDLTIVLFGIECAKELLKDRLRYNGLPEFSFAMEISERLVYQFQVLDPNMLLLSMLRHTWRKATGDPSIGRSPEMKTASYTIVSLLSGELRRHCGLILRKYRSRLPLDDEKRRRADWLASWLKQLPPWFWAMQWSARAYFLQRREDRLAQWRHRLQNVYEHLEQHYAERGREGLDDSLERAYIVEAAVLLASLAELPSEPGRNRRIRALREYRELFREIRNYLPNRPTKARVVEEIARALRSMEL
jgi:ppGpp synthetase/RelA/SpoT-type nucleotidyltranferase